MQKDSQSLEEKKIAIAGISYDSVDVLAKFSDQRKITLPLLSDPDHKTITAYGLLNKEAKGKTEGIPYPGIMIIDKKGTIRARLFYDGYRDRHAAEDIVKAVSEIK